MERERSVGVTVFGFFAIIFGLLGFIMTIFMAILALNPTSQLHAIDQGVLASLSDAIFNLCLFIAGIGILKLKHWGRILILIYAIKSLIELIYNSLIGGIHPLYPTLIFIIGPIILALGIIYFFTRPQVKEQFR